MGIIRTLDDIGNIVLKEQAGVPVFVRDVAEVQIGSEVRQGAIIKLTVAVESDTAHAQVSDVLDRVEVSQS